MKWGAELMLLCFVVAAAAAEEKGDDDDDDVVPRSAGPDKIKDDLRELFGHDVDIPEEQLDAIEKSANLKKEDKGDKAKEAEAAEKIADDEASDEDPEADLLPVKGDKEEEEEEKKKRKKPKKKRDYDNIPTSEKEMFGSKSLRCLVCKALVEEFDHAVRSVDPKKTVGTGSFRLNPKGDIEKTMIPYARSEGHLDEVLESICVEFEEYAQARERSNGEPTIIRIIDREGNMNARFSEIQIVPDEDLNTRLKFYCEGIVEEQEEDLIALFAQPRKGMTKELCYVRNNICPRRNVEKDEL